MHKPIQALNVYYETSNTKAGNTKIKVGRLGVQQRQIYFEYDASFIESNLQLSPFHLPLKTGVIISKDPVFAGLFGVFNDSLPDGWGRLLLDRQCVKHGINPAALSPLDRLYFVGSHGMGALCYEPEAETLATQEQQDLDSIYDTILLAQEQQDTSQIETLFQLSGSSCGARPKVVLNHAEAPWIIKFKSAYDPNDIGCIEYAYYLMAIAAKLDCSEAQLFASKKGPGFFGAKRFDRTQEGGRVHMHTVSGLLNADHRTPSLDYETLLKTTLHLTQDIHECEKLFRLCAFNVYSHNRDDHAKNFSFLMDQSGQWRLSPAYDLTFSSGPQGEHCTMIMGEGKTPSDKHLLALAKQSQIDTGKAQTILEEVKAAVEKWPQFADEAQVSKASKGRIAKVLKECLRA